MAIPQLLIIKRKVIITWAGPVLWNWKVSYIASRAGNIFKDTAKNKASTIAPFPIVIMVVGIETITIAEIGYLSAC